MKRAKWVALLLMCLASISESKGNDMSSELNIYTGDDKLAPYDFKIQSTVLGTVNPVIYGLLLTTTETQEILPGIIKSWDYNFHENTYKLKLGNEKFHNGREVETLSSRLSEDLFLHPKTITVFIFLASKGSQRLKWVTSSKAVWFLELKFWITKHFRSS